MRIEEMRVRIEIEGERRKDWSIDVEEERSRIEDQ
jgi:hypothetical protein